MPFFTPLKYIDWNDYMENFEKLLDSLNGGLSVVIMVLLLGTGILLTFCVRFLQVRKFTYSMSHTIVPTIKEIFKKSKKKKPGEISQFEAFSTAVAGTVGTGNIVGVATAIATGGPGAVFWMWFSAFFGMVTNYAENILGIYYREKNERGEYRGGAMYYITHGMGLKWLAILFALFCVLASIGFNLAQSNSISTTITESCGVPTWVVGIILAVIAGLVIIGGIQRISKMTSLVVPFMAVLFILLAIIIVCMNITNVPSAFGQIFKSAFNFRSVGGGILGYGIVRAMRYGVARGIFSNEAGLGSSVIAHSTANVKEPVHQGLWGVFEVFLDTFVICTLTALALLTTNAFGVGKEGAGIALYAFESNLGLFGKICFSIILPLFAFTTLISWSFYGEKSIEYLFGKKGVYVYKFIYVLLIIVGCIVGVQIVWTLSDIFNVLMAIPNLIALIYLSKTIKKITQNYFNRKRNIKEEPMLSYFPEENERIKNELLEENALYGETPDMTQKLHEEEYLESPILNDKDND